MEEKNALSGGGQRIETQHTTSSSWLRTSSPMKKLCKGPLVNSHSQDIHYFLHILMKLLSWLWAKLSDPTNFDTTFVSMAIDLCVLSAGDFWNYTYPQHQLKLCNIQHLSRHSHVWCWQKEGNLRFHLYVYIISCVWTNFLQNLTLTDIKIQKKLRNTGLFCLTTGAAQLHSHKVMKINERNPCKSRGDIYVE